VKAIQELRARKDGHVVTVGIGGPTGSGKTRSAAVSSVPLRLIAPFLGTVGDLLLLTAIWWLCAAQLG
jgi:hypothetical protein